MMDEITIVITDNLPDNPYMRLHMIIDMLENASEDYVVDKKWLKRQLQYVFDVFMEIAKEKYGEPILN